MPSSTSAPPLARDLVPGLAINLSGGDAARADRVWLSTGTQSAEVEGLSGYAENSFVPRLPWRAPTDAEWKTLARPAREIERPGHEIGIFRVPDAVLEAFAPLRELCHDETNLNRLSAACQDVAGRTALIEAARYALMLTDPQRPDIDAPAVHPKVPPGTPTMTTGRDNRMTGLHVDSWYRHGIADRAGSPNRISINLGVRDRHFLCFNLPLRDIAEAMPEVYDDSVGISFTMPRDFMREFADYPLVKLRVAPGEAYIAPTENVLHDGYAERAGGIDLQFTCRGYFHAPYSDT